MLYRICLSAGIVAMGASMAQADYTLTILHTNDFHDRFEPINRFNSTCAPEDNEAGECFGGVARLSTAIGDARAEAGENVLLLDAGDMFQGSLFFTQYGGDLAAEFMTQLDYDVFAVGNHEFNRGPEGLAAFIDQVEFPVLSANIDVSQSEALAGKVQKSVVLEVGGERIGIVSALAEDTPETSSPGPNVVFSSAADAVQAEIDSLTEDGVNKIILLTHVGLPADMRLAEAVTGADLIIGGHSHTLLSNSDEDAVGPYPTVVDGVPIFQAYAYGKYLGMIEATFDDAGEVTEISGDPMLLDASVAEDEAVVARIQELAEPLDEIRNEVVAQSSSPIDGERESCRAEECEMGNLVADAMLDRVADQGVQIAIQNGGGLRASIDSGEVTMGEVLTVLPFQNTLSTFEVAGQAIIDALENGVSEVEEGAGRFPQVAGLRFSWDATGEPGDRVRNVEVMEDGSWEQIDPDKLYGVVSNNYVRNGGDGYDMFIDAQNAYDFGPDLADVTAEYLAENAPYEPFTEGRITQAE